MDKLKDHAINTLGSKINKITDSSDNCKPKSKRPRVKKCTTTTKQILNFKPTLICRECIADRVVQPFIANNQHAMDFYLSEVHPSLLCSFCSIQEKKINKFITEKLLKEHQVNHHV